MRVLLPVLISAIAVFAEDPQAVTPGAPAPENVSIPARLSKSVDTSKCKAGDSFQMKTLEAVLIGNGLVMPENSVLHGTVVGAASRQNDQPSWVLLVVERADWQQHSVPLHAYITSQITIKTTTAGHNETPFGGAISLSDSLYHRRSRSQVNPNSGLSIAATHPARDGTIEASEAQQVTYQRLEDVHLLQAKNGAVFLVTPKNHLKLPSGTMFMLRNRAAPAAAQAATQIASGTTQ